MTFEIEDGDEFQNPLGTTQHQPTKRPAPIDVPPPAGGTTASPSSFASPTSFASGSSRQSRMSPPRTPGTPGSPGGPVRRMFRLTVSTDDPQLQEYFPDGPRKFPEGRGASTRAAATSYDEINALVAQNLNITDERGIYIVCHERDSDNFSFRLNPYAEDEAAKLKLFRAVPAAGEVNIAVKRTDGSLSSVASVSSPVLRKVATAGIFVAHAVDDAVETGGELVIKTVSYGGEHQNKRRRGLRQIRCVSRRHREPVGWFMLHPLSPTCVLWDIVHGFIVLYLFIFLPFTIAFQHADELKSSGTTSMLETTVVVDERFREYFGFKDDSKDIVFPSFDVFIDSLIIADFFLQFRTAYALEHNDESTKIVTSPKQIFIYRVFGRAFNYIPSVAFSVSLITSIPFDRLMTPYYGSRGAYYFRAIKCLRVEQLEHTKPFFDAFITKWTIVIPALKPMASLLTAGICAIGLCHVMSCLLYLSGHPMWEEPIWSETSELDEEGNHVNTTLTLEGYVCDETDSCGWVAGASWPENTTRWERYMTAYYYSFTIMSTVGFGDISAKNPTERFVTTWIMLVGVAMYAVVLGAITALIQSSNLGNAAFEETMAQMSTYLRSRGVHHELRRRIRQYYDFSYPQRVLFDENTVLSMLPAKLRADVKLDMYRDVVDAVPFLPTEEASSLDLDVVRLVLAGILKPLTCMDQEVIAHEGQRGNCMFIIVHGTVDVHFCGSNEVQMQLGLLDCFGETCCLEAGRIWNHTIVSAGSSALAKIERVELDW